MNTHTTSKGLVINIGDIVAAKGSKTLRVVVNIAKTFPSDEFEVCGTRCDENGKLIACRTAHVAWLNPETLKIIKKVAE
jgi:hypothetical protein